MFGHSTGYDTPSLRVIPSRTSAASPICGTHRGDTKLVAPDYAQTDPDSLLMSCILRVRAHAVSRSEGRRGALPDNFDPAREWHPPRGDHVRAESYTCECAVRWSEIVCRPPCAGATIHPRLRRLGAQAPLALGAACDERSGWGCFHEPNDDVRVCLWTHLGQQWGWPQQRGQNLFISRNLARVRMGAFEQGPQYDVAALTPESPSRQSSPRFPSPANRVWRHTHTSATPPLFAYAARCATAIAYSSARVSSVRADSPRLISGRAGKEYKITDEQRTEFRERGYTILRGFLSEDELTLFDEVYARFMDREIHVPDRDFCDMSKSFDTAFENFIVNCMLACVPLPLQGNLYEVLAESVAAQLYPDTEMRLDYDQLLNKRPGKEDAVFAMHQDMAYWPPRDVTPDTRTVTFEALRSTRRRGRTDALRSSTDQVSVKSCARTCLSERTATMRTRSRSRLARTNTCRLPR